MYVVHVRVLSRVRTKVLSYFRKYESSCTFKIDTFVLSYEIKYESTFETPQRTPSSNEIATIFFLHHLVPGINAELAKLGDFAFMLSAASGVRDRREARFRARSALSSRRARNSENATKGLCAALVCHHAKFRAQTCIAR